MNQFLIVGLSPIRNEITGNVSEQTTWTIIPNQPT